MINISLTDGHIDNAEHCVCCGAVIPEGRQVCIICGLKTNYKQSTADVVEARHGRWEVTEHNAHLNVVCSNCNKEFYVYKKGQYRIDRSDYCPNCGAKMDGKDGE